MENIKWVAPDSSDGERTLKQHAFVSVIQEERFTMVEYSGNKALCGSGFISDDGERGVPFNRVQAENFNEQNACSKCLKIFKKEYEKI